MTKIVMENGITETFTHKIEWRDELKIPKNSVNFFEEHREQSRALEMTNPFAADNFFPNEISEKKNAENLEEKNSLECCEKKRDPIDSSSRLISSSTIDPETDITLMPTRTDKSVPTQIQNYFSPFLNPAIGTVF